MGETVYVVEDSMGVICLCATRDLAKQYANEYWCSYIWTEVIDKPYGDTAGIMPKIHDPIREPE